VDLTTILQVLVWRWRVFVPGLVLTIGMVVYLAMFLPPEYESFGSLVLVNRTRGQEAIEPRVLAELVQDGASQQSLVDQGYKAQFQVTADDTGILTVEASDDDADTAVETAQAVLGRLQGVLAGREDEDRIPSNARSQAEVLSTPRYAVPVRTGGERTFVATGSARLVPLGERQQEDSVVQFTPLEVRNLLIDELMSPAVRAKLEAEGGAPYELTTDENVPTIRIAVVASDRDQAVNTVRKVMEAAPDSLVRLQDLATSNVDNLAVVPYIAPGEPTAKITGVLRSLVALGMVGLFASVGLALLAERLARPVPRPRRTPAAPSSQNGEVHVLSPGSLYDALKEDARRRAGTRR
jgi:hypothetical protein